MKKKYYLFEMKNFPLQIISTVLLIVMVLFTYLLCEDINGLDSGFALSFILMIPYMILHEIVHSMSYVINGANFKNITYGVHLDKGILCCLCKQNISKRNILISLLSPFFVIGIITYIIGILIGNWLLIILSIFNISGCSGDLVMFIGLSRIKDFEFSEYDNPMAFGLYTNQDLSKKKMFGLKYLDTVDSLEKNDFKKVSISKSSIWTALIYVMMGLIMLFI